MGMPNREVAALERHARANEELAKAISSRAGKEYMKQVKLLENAAGGAKKLAKADKVLDMARLEAAKITAEADTAAIMRMHAADDEIEAAKAELEEERRVFGNQRAQVNGRAKAQKLKSGEIADAERGQKGREGELAMRESEVAARESKATAREKAAATREAEIKRKDAYYAGAPA